MNPTLKGIDQWPNTAPSSPATPSESPERVETAGGGFQAEWREAGEMAEKENMACLEFLVSYRQQNGGIGLYSEEAMDDAFRAGYEAGRKAK